MAELIQAGYFYEILSPLKAYPKFLNKMLRDDNFDDIEADDQKTYLLNQQQQSAAGAQNN